MDIPDHSTFWNNYYIYREEIGSGSYSKVYKAVDTKTREFVAIKKIPKQRLSQNLIDRFSNEINILQSLKHPNIIELKNYLITNKNIFIIMEYCNSGTLKDILSDDLGEKVVQHIVQQIVKAMYYLDTKGIVHRDIKPDNILLKDNVIKLVDFGFSCEIKEESNMLSTICGTPIYMSPELLNCKTYTKKSDIWSLGVITYELFHSFNPFAKCKNMQELNEFIHSKKILFRNDISEHLLDFLYQTLQISADDRPNFNELIQHNWFHKPLLNIKNINEPIFDMEDFTENDLKSTNDTNNYSSYYTIKHLFLNSSNEHDIFLNTNSGVNDTEDKIEENRLESPKKSSKPVPIKNNKPHKIEIIENFFDKPNTYDNNQLVNYNSSSFKNYKSKHVSDSFLKLPVKIIRSLINFTNGSF